METKKLKKLSINKMDDFPVIGEWEQMALKGGGDPVWSEEFQSWMIDEVTVYGEAGHVRYIEKCGVCDMERFGQHGGGNWGAQAVLQAWWGVEHYLGAHEDVITRDTIWVSD